MENLNMKTFAVTNVLFKKKAVTLSLNMNKYFVQVIYRGADKSLARPRRKEANVFVRMA